MPDRVEEKQPSGAIMKTLGLHGGMSCHESTGFHRPG